MSLYTVYVYLEPSELLIFTAANNTGAPFELGEVGDPRHPIKNLGCIFISYFFYACIPPAHAVADSYNIHQREITARASLSFGSLLFLYMTANLAPRPAVTQQLEAVIANVQQREASLRQEIVTSRLQHLAVSRDAEAESDLAAARLLERMSSFQVMGILFVLSDFLAILIEVNKLF